MVQSSAPPRKFPQHCFCCGAYLAGSWTQHTPACPFHEYTKDVNVPAADKQHLLSLAAKPPELP